MEESQDRELEAILKLIKLTQDGNIKWQAKKPWGDLVNSETTKYASVFFCLHDGKRLRIFIEKQRHDKPFYYETSWVMANLDKRTYPYWDEGVELEITNEDGQSLWRFPHKSAISDLLNAAKYQVAGVKDFLDSLSSNSPERASISK